MAEAQGRSYPEFTETGFRHCVNGIYDVFALIEKHKNTLNQLNRTIIDIREQINTASSERVETFSEERLDVIVAGQQQLEKEIKQMRQEFEQKLAEARQIVEDVGHAMVNLKKEPEPAVEQNTGAANVNNTAGTIPNRILELQVEEPKASIEVEALKATVQELSERIQKLEEPKNHSQLELLENQNAENKSEVFEEPKRLAPDTPQNMLPVEIVSESSVEDAEEPEWTTALTTQFSSHAQEQCSADQRDYEKAYTEWKFWGETCSSVNSKIPSLIQCAEQLLPGLILSENLSTETYKLAEARLKSLETLRKMILRLEDKREPLNGNASAFGTLESVDAEALSDAIKDQSDSEAAKRQLLAYLEEKGNERYAVIKSVEDAAGSRRKAVTNFIERSILPIADGLEEGISYTEELKAAAGEEAELLPDFTNAYKFLLNGVSEIIGAGGVEQIPIELGEPADFLCMEPIDIEPDEQFSDETVKRVSRAGYRLREDLPVSQAKTIMRNAQIVVVKN